MEFQNKWDEEIRLFHKFCPKAKSIILSPRDLKMDNIYRLIKWIDPEAEGGTVHTYEDSLSQFDFVYGENLKNENSRVIVFPDISWDAKPPFVCAANKLRERIDEGAETWRSENPERWEYIDGCSDVLFVFETSGNIVFFDHHEGYAVASPRFI